MILVCRYPPRKLLTPQSLSGAPAHVLAPPGGPCVPAAAPVLHHPLGRPVRLTGSLDSVGYPTICRRDSATLKSPLNTLLRSTDGLVAQTRWDNLQPMFCNTSDYPFPTPITPIPPIAADPAYTYPTTPRGPCTPTRRGISPTLPDAHTDSSPAEPTHSAPLTLEVTQRLSDRRETDSCGFVLGRGRAVLWGPHWVARWNSLQ